MLPIVFFHLINGFLKGLTRRFYDKSEVLASSTVLATKTSSSNRLKETSSYPTGFIMARDLLEGRGEPAWMPSIEGSRKLSSMVFTMLS